MELFGALYASDAKRLLTLQDKNDILTASQNNNRNSSITGLLYEERDVFLQYLEGPRQAIYETLNRIRVDDRHSNLHLIWTGGTKTRYFGDWEMGFLQQRSVCLGELVNLKNGSAQLAQFDPIDLLVFLSSSNQLIDHHAA